MLSHAAHDPEDERQEPDSVQSLLHILEAFAPFNIREHRQSALPAKDVVEFIFWLCPAPPGYSTRS